MTTPDFTAIALRTITATPTSMPPSPERVLGVLYCAFAIVIAIAGICLAGAAAVGDFKARLRGEVVTAPAVLVIGLFGAALWPAVVATGLSYLMAIGVRDLARLAFALRPRRESKSTLPRAEVRK